MKRNWLEWGILAASVATIVGLVGFLVVDAVVDGGRPPLVGATVQADRGTESDGGWIVPIRVHNSGGTAALSVVVEAAATVDGVDEVNVLTVNVLAGGSEVELFAGFSAAPDDPVRVRIAGLETP